MFSGRLSGAGGLTKTGGGGLTLSGSNLDYSGTTTINEGRLIVNLGTNLGSGAVVINSGGILEIATDTGGPFSNRFSGSGGIIKTGAGEAYIGGTDPSVGSIAVQQGKMTFVHSGIFSVTAADGYSIAEGASTELFKGAHFNITNAYTQQSNTTLTVDLDYGSDAVITAGSAQIGGTLSVSNINSIIPGDAGLLNSRRRVIISTTGVITGEFDDVYLDPSETSLDYLVITSYQTSNTYSVGLGLTWEAGEQKGNGIFTLVGNDSFNVDVALNDQTGPFESGWNGRDLTKKGTGRLNLSAANGYSGTTTINAGTLRTTVANAFVNSSAVTVAAGATLELLGYNQTANNLSGAGSITATTAILTVNNDSDGTIFDGIISGGGRFSKTGAGKATLTANESGLGTASVNAGELVLAANTNNTANGFVNGSVLTINANALLSVNNGAFAQDDTAELKITLGLNKPYAKPMINAQSVNLDGKLTIAGFGAGTRYSVISANRQVIITSDSPINNDFSSIDFGGAASNYDFLTLDGHVDSGDLSYSVGFGLTWQAAPAVAHGTFTLTDADAVFNVDEELADRSGITSGWDGKSLTKAGAGTLILGAQNTYSGKTTVNGGTLQTDVVNAFANSESVEVAQGAKLNLDDNDQIANNLQGEGEVLLGTATLTVNNSVTDTAFNGKISGAGGITKTGGGTFTLGDVNDYAGGTIINGGTLAVNKTSGLGTGAVTINGGGALDFNITQNETATFTNAISGTGNIAKTGGGEAVITNAGSAGVVNVTGGMLTFNHNGYFTATNYTTANGATTYIGPTAQLNITNAFTQNANAVLTVEYGNGTVAVETGNAVLGGTLNIAGFSVNNPVNASEVDNQTFVVIEATSGTITGDFSSVNFGTSGAAADYVIVAGSKSTNEKQYSVFMGLTWLAGNVHGNGVFTLGSANDYFNVDISLGDQSASQTGWSGRDLTKNGPGTLELSKNNTYTGVTTVNGGILKLTADGALGATSNLAINGGTVIMDGTLQMVGKLNTQPGAKLDIGSGRFTISDALRLSGDSDGGLVNGGTLAGSGTLIIDPSILRVNGANNDFTGNVIIRDGSSLVMNNGAGVGTQGNIDLEAANDLLVFDNVSGSNASGTLTKTVSGVGQVQTRNGADITLGADNSGFSGTFDVGTGSVLRANRGLNLGTANMLVAGRFVANAQNDWQFTNSVTGSGVFEKTGAGEMLVDQALSGFNGTVLVNEGAFLVGDANTTNAMVGAQNVEVGPDGVLSGSGTIRGAVVNHGFVSALNTLTNHADTGPSNLTIGPLTNTGTINLAGTQIGNTLTVTGGMQGGGELIINTVVGDDNSLTDRLILDGGATTGATGLQVLNRDGQGAATNVGILVVEAQNGATTAGDAFMLSQQTPGYRSYRGTLVVGGYDYSLVKGGNNGQSESWYLVSQVDEGIPSARPESGVYLANREVAEDMFRLGLHDRLAGYEKLIESASGIKVTGVVWARAYASQGTTHADHNNLRTKSHVYVFQGGADFIGWSAPEFGSINIGTMFGIGKTKNDTKARSDGSYKADGCTEGYALGVYATWFADAEHRKGLYVDSWLQHAWFDNKTKGSGIAEEKYDSRLWSASLETGYAFDLYKAPNRTISLEPFVQVIYNNYRADTITEASGTRIKPSSNGSFSTRLGARIEGRFFINESLRLTPYLEASWLHNSKTHAVNMDFDRISSSRSKDLAQVKLGVSGQVAEKVSLSLGGWGNFGGKYEQYGGEITLRVEW